MVVDGMDVAAELRRRRVGRPALVAALRNGAAPTRFTWLPGDLRAVPTSLLVLAALSLARADR